MGEEMDIDLDERFKPHPNLKRVYRTYTAMVLIIPALVTVIALAAGGVSVAALVSLVVWTVFLVPALFALYWINRFFDTVFFKLTDSEVVVEKGVWFKQVQNVPYRQITNVTTKQGPIYRHFGLGKAEIQTAGHSANQSGPEASIFGVRDFKGVRDQLIEIIREEKAAPVSLPGGGGEAGPNRQMLEELRSIKDILERKL